MLTELTKYFEVVYENNIIREVVAKPENSICSSCKTTLCEKSHKKGIILVNSVAFRAVIFVLHCVNENCINKHIEISFNGTESGFVNYNNNLLIAIEDVFEFSDLHANTGVALYSYLKSKYLDISNDSLPIKIMPLAGKIHAGMCEALESFDKEFSPCCDFDEGVTCDALVVSIKTRNMPDYQKIFEHITVEGRTTTRAQRTFRITMTEKAIIGKCIKRTSLSIEDIALLQTSKNIAAQCVGYAIKGKRLDNGAKGFAESLLKLVNPVVNLICKDSLAIMAQ